MKQNSMLMLAAVVLLLFVSVGCLGTGETAQKGDNVVPQQKCTIVTENKPVTKEECGDVSITDDVCGIRKLNYTKVYPTRTGICLEDGPCSGKSLGECTACSQAMSRCMVIIKNEDTNRTGTWKVGANFTLPQGNIVKEPMTLAIRPGEAGTFDFQQMYWPGNPINSAVCTLYVIEAPEIDDCHQETRTRKDCRNVTTTTTIQREVCQ